MFNSCLIIPAGCTAENRTIDLSINSTEARQVTPPGPKKFIVKCGEHEEEVQAILPFVSATQANFAIIMCKCFWLALEMYDWNVLSLLIS